MSLEIVSASTERTEQREVCGCTQRLQTAWPCLGFAVEITWLALGGLFLSFLGPLFPAFEACFSATAGCHSLRDLIRSFLIGG